MTRGGLLLYSLAVIVAIWLGYRVMNEDRIKKEQIMTQKEQITKLQQEVAEYRSREKQVNARLEELHNQNTKLTKENSNLRTLMDIHRDKLVLAMSKNQRLLKSNADKLKEVRALMDSVILFNLEELANDGQSRKSETGEQR